MKSIKKLEGHTSNKYGTTYTKEQAKINELIDRVKLLERKVNVLENTVKV